MEMNMNILEISGMQNEAEKFSNLYRENPRSVILYGGGQGADWVIRLFRTLGIKVNMIIDRNAMGKKMGIPIMCYENFLAEYKDRAVYIVIASPRYEMEIRDALERDFSSEDIFCFECELYYSYIKDMKQYRQWLKEHKKDFDHLYNRLEDELSKSTLESVLKGRISAKLDYFRNVFVPDQYFAKDVVKLQENGIFCDVGAYIGDTVQQIVNITEGKYKKIYCFEPDVKCCEELSRNIQGKNVTVIRKGAWNKEETLYLQDDANHGASAISDNGDYKIELDCIDHCIDPSDRIFHIKMDIEGAELNALKGAEKIIKRDKPILAICVYHKNEDFLNIPKFILSIVPEYKIYLRHHNVSGTETVLYAVKGD